MTNKVRTIFFGTPGFALASLVKLLKNVNIKIITVVTRPDKRAGRNQKFQASPIKAVAIKNDLPILQPEKINKHFIDQVIKLAPELFVVVAYGAILPKTLLEVPKFGVLNLHASLLPKYRGPSPIQSAILAGDKITGNTIILLDEKIDHGPIINQQKINIKPDETSQSLHDKLAVSGAKLLNETVNLWIKQKIRAKTQDENKASYSQLILREDGKINWQKTAREIERQIRAFYPWPGAFTFYNKKRLKIISVLILNPEMPKNKKQAGLIFLTPEKNLGITCGQGTLIISELQLEGSSIMSSKKFVLGHKDIIGQKLG